MTLAVLYVPNTSEEQYLAEILNKLDAFKTGEIILGGDFNSIINHKLDRSQNTEETSRKIAPQESSKIAEMFTHYNLIDLWRTQHPLERDYTYYSGRHQSHTRIDYILISAPVLQKNL